MGVRMVDGCEGGGEENGGHEDSDKGDEEGGGEAGEEGGSTSEDEQLALSVCWWLLHLSVTKTQFTFLINHLSQESTFSSSDILINRLSHQSTFFIFSSTYRNF